FFFQAEAGIRDLTVTGVQTCALPICCSCSARIPGVADSLSSIFREADMPTLVAVEVNDDEAIETTRRLIRMGFPVGPSSGLNYRSEERRVGKSGNLRGSRHLSQKTAT